MTPNGTSTAQFLAPILQAAALLKTRIHSSDVEQLTAVLNLLNPRYPGDTLSPLDALQILASGNQGSVDELQLLAHVWPGWSGDVRFKLTPFTLTWQWSSRHSGVYATITVPFPTVLPMDVRVIRFCDMDSPDNHRDECPLRDGHDDCNCEAFVEQEVSATITEWDDVAEAELGAWLGVAVIGQVSPAVFPVKDGAK